MTNPLETPRTLTAIALLAFALPTMAFAHGDRGQARMVMPQLDFAQMDTNADGGVTQQEWTTFITAQVAERQAERLATRADRLMDAADADADGVLNRDELIGGMEALAQTRREARAEGGRREGRRGMRGHRRGGGRMDPAERAAHIFERADRDESGTLDAEEVAMIQERMESRMQRWQERRGG